MALQRVPGVRGYKADSAGLADLGRSTGMAKASLEAAKRLEGNAEAVGDSKYESANATVTIGWANEKRAGAVVRETESHWRDWRDAVLLRVADNMRVRGGS